MKKLPRKNKQWAKEAYESLQKATALYTEEFPNPTGEDKIQFYKNCVAFAAMNRGITDKEKIKNVNAKVYGDLVQDLLSEDPEKKKKSPAVTFLLCYLDAQVSFGFITESKGDEIIRFVIDNMAIDDEM